MNNSYQIIAVMTSTILSICADGKRHRVELWNQTLAKFGVIYICLVS